MATAAAGSPNATVSAPATSAPDVEGDREAPSELPSSSEVADPEDGDVQATAAEEATQENLDSLLHDLKNLDQSGESTGGASQLASTTQTPAAPTTAPSTTPPSTQPTVKTPQTQTQTQSVQKESVFVRLANRIKALERNMSLSGQYLEELSRRYKKQMEEMQKAFNRTLQAVHEAGRIGEEREAKRQEEMQLLQEQLTKVSDTLQDLLGERESWLSRLSIFAQHLILISVEVVIFVLLVNFCRHVPDSGGTGNVDASRKLSTGVKGRKGIRVSVKRRKSVDGVCGHESPRTRNRRPSEEALLIAGSYQDLLIGDAGGEEIDGLVNFSKADSRRRRRKKKDLLLRSASVRLPVKSSEPLINLAEEQQHVPSRRANSMEVEVGGWWESSNGVDTAIVEDEKVGQNSQQVHLQQPSSSDASCSETNHSSTVESISAHSLPADSCSQHDVGSQKQSKSNNTHSEVRTKLRSVSDTVPPLPKNNGLVRSSMVSGAVQRQLSTPVFMRTATSMRNSRLGSTSVEPSPPAKLKSDNWEWYSTHHGLDKSSQPNKVTCSVSCPGNGPGDGSQRQNGHSASDDNRRNSNASGASSTSNISEGVSQKDTCKKGPSSLKKMVKKFF